MAPLSRLQIRQEIHKLNRLDLTRASFQAIRTTYDRLIHGLEIEVGGAGGGELFFRVRRTGGKKPSQVTELQAPPSEYVTGYQRCNPPKIPMFYAASRRIGALVESRANATETIYLSQWIGRNGIPVNRVFDSGQSLFDAVEGISTIHGPNEDLVLAHIDTCFTRRIHSDFADDYKITAAIAQILTSRFAPQKDLDIRADGQVALKYPSVLGLDRWHNTAMHAHFAAERLELLHVMELKIVSHEDADILVEILDTATDFDDGIIHWTSNPTLVPALLAKDRGVPFVFNGKRWKLQLHDAPITPDYIKALLVD